MIRQSIINKFDKKYVKANIGGRGGKDDSSLYGGSANTDYGVGRSNPDGMGLFDGSRLEGRFDKTKLTGTEGDIDNMVKFFKSHLNDKANEKNTKFGPLEALSKSPFNYEPMIKIIGIMQSAVKSFMNTGNEELLPFFNKIKDILENEIKINSKEACDEFKDNYLENLDKIENQNLVQSFNTKEAAQGLWNKIGSFYIQYVKPMILKLKGDVSSIPVKIQDLESYESSVTDNQVATFTNQNNFSIFRFYESDRARPFMLKAVRSANESLSKYFVKLINGYVKEQGPNYRAAFMDKKSKDSEFQEIVKILGSAKDDYNLHNAQEGQKTKDRAEEAAAAEKAAIELAKQNGTTPDIEDYKGLSLQTHTQFAAYLKKDLELKTIIHSLNNNQNDASTIFLKVLKAKSEDLYTKFSQGVRAASKPSPTAGITVEDKIAEFKQTKVYQVAIKTINDYLNRGVEKPAPVERDYLKEYQDKIRFNQTSSANKTKSTDLVKLEDELTLLEEKKMDLVSEITRIDSKSKKSEKDMETLKNFRSLNKELANQKIILENKIRAAGGKV